MGSNTKRTRGQRNNKLKKQGRKRKLANVKNGTTPKFDIHIK